MVFLKEMQKNKIRKIKLYSFNYSGKEVYNIGNENNDY